MKQSIVGLGRAAHGSALALFRFGFGIILFLHFCSQTMSGELSPCAGLDPPAAGMMPLI